MNLINIEIILNEIKAEREKQNKKWGVQNHSVIEWQAILMEEVGEVAREAADFHFINPIKDESGVYHHVYHGDKIQKQRLIDYRKELIQVAAVAIHMIECLDRNRS